MIKLEERVFMGKKIIDIWGTPEMVLSMMDDMLNMGGFYLTQFHPFQVLPFYHAMLEYIPKKEKWHRRIFNAKKKGNNNPIYERLQEEEEELSLQQAIDEDSKPIGKRFRRMQDL